MENTHTDRHTHRTSTVTLAHARRGLIMKEFSTSLWFSVIADETVDISLVEQVCK